MVQGRKPQKQLTPLELRIMQILWAAGPSPVQMVQQRRGNARATSQDRSWAGHTNIDRYEVGT